MTLNEFINRKERSRSWGWSTCSRMMHNEEANMRYKDERGWLYEVKPGLHIAGWTIYSFNPKKEKWWPWPCACWYETQKEAEKFLRRFAREHDWQKAV